MFIWFTVRVFRKRLSIRVCVCVCASACVRVSLSLSFEQHIKLSEQVKEIKLSRPFTGSVVCTLRN